MGEPQPIHHVGMIGIGKLHEVVAGNDGLGCGIIVHIVGSSGPDRRGGKNVGPGHTGGIGSIHHSDFTAGRVRIGHPSPGRGLIAKVLGHETELIVGIEEAVVRAKIGPVGIALINLERNLHPGCIPKGIHEDVLHASSVQGGQIRTRENDRLVHSGQIRDSLNGGVNSACSKDKHEYQRAEQSLSPTKTDPHSRLPCGGMSFLFA